MSTIYDVIIIGGGPAGLCCATYCARSGLKVAVFEKSTYGGQMILATSIDNYPAIEEVDGFTIGNKMKVSAQRFGAEVIYKEITSVELRGKIKYVNCGKLSFMTKAVVVATGASPKKLNLPHEEFLTGKGISYCASCDGNFFKNKTVAVVGGGNSAVTNALTLSKICKNVFIIHRKNHLTATKIYTDALSKYNNVKFLFNNKVESFIFNQKLTGVVIEDITTGAKNKLTTDGVFICIGRTPSSSLFANQLELTPDGYIVSDETCHTNLKGVFVAGDVRTKKFRQIVTALADGANAAYFAEQYINEMYF